MSNEHFDILIVGAGLAGIGAACWLQREFPGRSVAILERRNALGGTWELFRYPGIRSDTDMYNYGYGFRLWHEPKILADGSAIRNYIADTAREYGVDRKIIYGVKVVSADWSSADQRWTVMTLHEASGEAGRYSCNFMIACTGYYDQDAGFLPTFPGEARFRGRRVHPQHWPERSGLHAGKQVVVIGKRRDGLYPRARDGRRDGAHHAVAALAFVCGIGAGFR